MPFVTAGDGTELHYETEGEGFPLVFTHGNMGFGQQLFLQTRVFRCHYRCVLHGSRHAVPVGNFKSDANRANQRDKQQPHKNGDCAALIPPEATHAVIE